MRLRLHTRQLRHRRGFSLLELSIVIAIVSVVAVMGLEGVASYLSYTAYRATENRMKTIEEAIARYRYVHGRLPCPAALTTNINNGAYGAENCGGVATLNGGISRITSAGGAGYSAGGFLVPFTGGGGYGATGIAVVAGGVITSVSVPMPGYGYSTAPMADLNAGEGVPAPTTLATLTPGVTVGRVDTPVTIGTGGVGYFPAPLPSNFPLGITGGGSAGNPSGAIATAHFNGAGIINDVVVSDPGYGFTAAPTFNDAAGAPITPAAFAAVTTIFAGGLPVRDLGLPISYALDAYGSKFMYYVTGDLTDAATYRNAIGNIQVRAGVLDEPCDTNCTVTATNAAYALISVGRDQRGGHNQRGIAIQPCIPDANFNSAIDAQNCLYALTATPGTPTVPSIPAGVLYQSPFSNGSVETNYTDDLVIYHLKSEL